MSDTSHRVGVVSTLAIDLAPVEEILTARLQSVGLELVLAEYLILGGRPTLRVYIDRPEGIDLQDCVRANDTLVEVAELDELIPGSYDLEVSSPGVERPLRKLSDFERFVGERVQLRTSTKIDGRQKLVGRLVAVVDGTVQLELESGVLDVPHAVISRANLKPDFAELLGEKPRPGRRSRPGG